MNKREKQINMLFEGSILFVLSLMVPYVIVAFISLELLFWEWPVYVRGIVVTANIFCLGMSLIYLGIKYTQS